MDIAILRMWWIVGNQVDIRALIWIQILRNITPTLMDVRPNNYRLQEVWRTMMSGMETLRNEIAREGGIASSTGGRNSATSS
jgi:hypothetical protein